MRERRCTVCSEVTRNYRVCDACIPREAAAREALEGLAGERERDTAHGLYGGTWQYALALVELARSMGCEVHHNQHRRRFPRGSNPWEAAVARGWANRSGANGYYWYSVVERLDHPVLLRRQDGSGWALIGQNYGGPDDAPLAPYGHGTRLTVVTTW